MEDDCSLQALAFSNRALSLAWIQDSTGSLALDALDGSYMYTE